jgi:hypothetical protein
MTCVKELQKVEGLTRTNFTKHNVIGSVPQRGL